jgi:hypothetical protein
MKKLVSLFILAICLISTVSCIRSEVPVIETYSETQYRTESYVEIGNEHQEYMTPKWERYAPMYFTKLEWAKEGAESSIDGYAISTAKLSKSQIKLILSNNPQASLWGILVVNLTGIGPISEPPPQSGSAVRELVNGEEKYIPPPAEQQWIDGLNAIMTDPKYVLFFARSDQYTGSDITINVTGVEEFAVITCTPPYWLENPGPIVEKVQLIWSDEAVKERQVPYQVEEQRTVMQTKQVPFWEAWKTNSPAETEPSSPSTIGAKPAVTETSSNTTTTEARPATISDDFSNPDSGWGTSSDDSGQYAYQDGEYSISIEKMNWFGYHLNSGSGKLEDFTAEVDIRRLSQGTDDAAGIVFRDQREQGKDSFYVFWVDSSSGTYAIQKYIQGIWAPNLKNFTSSGYINGDANTNRLKVVCKGSQIEVYANDNKLTTVTDTSFTSGFIGLAVETITSSNANYHFDNFELYTND